MNERIRELAYKAEDYADYIVDQGGEFHPAYTKKLVEWIIWECIMHLHCRGIEFDIVEERMLKEHFGIRN